MRSLAAYRAMPGAIGSTFVPSFTLTGHTVGESVRQPLRPALAVSAPHLQAARGRALRPPRKFAAAAAAAVAAAAIRSRYSDASWLTRSTRACRVARCAVDEEDDEDEPPKREDLPPAVIIGGGRLGDAFYNMGLGQDVIVKRGDPFPVNAPVGPIYVCTRNDALKDVIAMTPPERREDLVFVQNGALKPFLAKELGEKTPVTILLVYFAVAKKGEKPLDGKTDTDPEGLSAVNSNGKWAKEVAWRLQTSRMSLRVLDNAQFNQAYWEKNLWICAYMLVGALHGGCTVGQVESEHRAEVDDMISEMAAALTAADPDLRWTRARLCDRLAAYARSVAHFPTAVKEFEWRNGAFYDLTLQAQALGRPDPSPLHTAGLKKLGLVKD